MRRGYLSLGLQFSLGLAYSSAHPVGMAAAIAMPTFALRQYSRPAAYRAAICYYAGALWPLIPGARNFFGPNVSPLTALALWAMACILLGSPWLVAWSSNRSQFWWRSACGLILGVLPPLGLIGWASPLTVSGLLFPATHWWGLAACAVLPGLLAVYPRHAVPVFAAVSTICNLTYAPQQPPSGWEAVDTQFGAIAHGSEDPIAEYRAARSMQRTLATRRAQVFVFPETVVSTWTAATDAFWNSTMAYLQATGRIAIIGTRLPVAGTLAVPPRQDFSAAAAVLKGDSPPPLHRGSTHAGFAYDNAAVVRGAQTAVFVQRIPVPFAMWKPFERDGARLHTFESGIVTIKQRRAAILICYEQLLVLPAITSLMHNPDILLGIANDYWVRATPVPDHQRMCLRAWSRLFSLPYLSATNL